MVWRQRSDERQSSGGEDSTRAGKDIEATRKSVQDITMSYESDSSSEGDCAFDSDEATCDGEPVFPMKEEIRYGDVSAVQQALADGRLDPNARDEDYTVLHWAAGHTDMDHLKEESLSTDNIASRRMIVCELLERGAIVNRVWLREEASGESPVTPIDMTEDEGVVLMLREASIRQALAADETSSLGDWANHLRIGLISAAALGRTKDCAKLCRLGAAINDNTLGTMALGTAAAFGHLKTVQMLVQDLGANVDTLLNEDSEQTALFIAVYEGYEEIVDFLLKHRANPLLQTTLYGGMSSWACAGLIDRNVRQGVDLAVRNRIIEIVLSASVDMVKDQVLEKTHYGKYERNSYSWVFMECVRHGCFCGMDQLLENPQFELPPTCLQLATAVGDHTTFKYLLNAGALDSYNGDWEEERWYGPDFARPLDSEIQRCKATLNEWLQYKRQDVKGLL